MTLSDAKPLFLTGYPKSGTTLLLSLLDGHPELCVFPKETKFLTIARRQIEADRNRGVKCFFRRSLRSAQFGMQETIALPLDEERYLAALEDRWKNRGYEISAFLESAVLAFGEATGKTDAKWWVEKTPYTERYARMLLEWYPEMRMIFLIRDPRANFASIKRWYRQLGKSYHVSRFADLWSDSTMQNERNSAICPVHTLRYEDLVADCVGTMKRVCDFLDIQYDECLARPTIAGERFQGNSVYGDTFSGVSDASLNRWRDELTVGEIQQIDTFLGRWMRRYGYPLQHVRCAARWLRPDMLGSLAMYRMRRLYARIPDRLKECYRKLRHGRRSLWEEG